MAVLSGIDKWQDAFMEYSVAEISQLNAQLRDHVTAKKLELRDLVGNRYRDMLKTADIILAMNETVGKEDEALSDLCTAGKYSSWATHAENVTKFSDPQSDSRNSAPSTSLSNKATESLLYAMVSFTRRHVRGCKSTSRTPYHQDYVLIARGIWLARLLLDHSRESLGKRKFQIMKSEIEQLNNTFQQTVNSLLLQGTNSDVIPFSSYNNLFLAYTISHQVNPVAVMQKTLAARLEYISTVLKNRGRPEITFPYVLKLISSAFTIVKSGFKKNALERTIFQQTEVYSLLDTPEFANQAEINIERYKRWLPESISTLRAFPYSCFEGIPNSGRPSAKSSAFLTKSLNSFSHDIARVMSNNLPSIFESIQDLHTMVELYRKVLVFVQDTPSLRKLSLEGDGDDDAETFYRSIFLPLWVNRFNEIMETEINKLLSTEVSLSTIHANILGNSGVGPSSLSTTDYIFSQEFLANSTSAKGADFANILIDALSDFANGSIGDIKDISHEYQAWLDSVSAVQSHVEEVGRMKGMLSVRYSNSTKKDDEEDYYDEDDDEEAAEFWRRIEKKVITTNHKLFGEHAKKSLTSVHGEMLKRVEKLAQQNGTNTRGLVLLLRAVLLLESHFQSLAPFSLENTQNFVKSTYSNLGDCITSTLLDLIDIDLYRGDTIYREFWIEDGQCPSGPSLYLFDYLSKLVRNLTAEIGHDELLWRNEEGLRILRDKVCQGILKVLNKAAIDLNDAQAKVEASAQLRVARVEAHDEAREETEKDTKHKVKEEAKIEVEVEAKEDAKEEAEEETKDKAKEETEANTEAGLTEQDEVEVKTEAEAEPETKPEVEPKAEPELKAEAEPEAEPKAKAETESTPEAKSEEPAESSPQLDDISSCLLQLTMDSKFVCELIGVKFPKNEIQHDEPSQEVLEKMDKAVRDVVKRTRILYLPLAV